MKNINEKALALHKDNQGKIEMRSKVPLQKSRDLTLAYSPGVAAPCLEIKKDPETIYDYTAKGNMVAVVTNGSAVLGLGNIGAGAGLPVMEGRPSCSRDSPVSIPSPSAWIRRTSMRLSAPSNSWLRRLAASTLRTSSTAVLRHRAPPAREARYPGLPR